MMEWISVKVRGQTVLNPIERIKKLSKENPNNGCWEWISSKSGKTKLREYGRLIVGSRTDGTRKTMQAHRYSYNVFKGEIPDGMFVCHKCDNPSCVNPEHLFLGTRQDNVNDREAKGRNNLCGLGLKAESHPKAKLTWDKVNEIRLIGNSMKINKIAELYGVDRRTVRDVLQNKTWKIPPPPKQSNGTT